MNLKRCLQPVPHSNTVSVALLLLRVVAGSAFVIHGWGKMENPMGWMGPASTIPAFFQLLATTAEFGGGVAWILGLLVPLASLGIACTMTVAVFTLAIVFGNPFVNLSGGGAYELPAAFFCIAVVLFFAGPGRFSLDRMIFGQR